MRAIQRAAAFREIPIRASSMPRTVPMTPDVTARTRVFGSPTANILGRTSPIAFQSRKVSESSLKISTERAGLLRGNLDGLAARLPALRGLLGSRRAVRIPLGRELGPCAV